MRVSYIHARTRLQHRLYIARDILLKTDILWNFQLFKPHRRTTSKLEPCPAYQMLQFWTVAVNFTMANFEVFYGEACTLDNQQARCGFLFMDGFEEDAFFALNTQYEFILLSEFKTDVTSSLSLPHDYPPPSHIKA